MPRGVRLEPRQKLFVVEYLKDLHATNAAIRAGYSAHSAKQAGSALLNMPKVKAAIDEALAARRERVEIKADDVLRELYRLATTDISEAFEENGALKPIHEIPPDVRRAISAVEVDELFETQDRMKVQVGLTKKIKFWDKTRALEMLAKHLKLLTDKVEVSADSSFADVLKAARERAKR